MDLRRLRARVGDVDVEGTATLDGYRHCFNKLGIDGTAKGNLELDPEARVWGVIYALSEGQLSRLDAHEGGYNRFDIEVSSNGSLLTAAITYRSHRIDDAVRPTTEYLHHYLAGAEQHSLPGEYVRAILPSWYWAAS